MKDNDTWKDKKIKDYSVLFNVAFCGCYNSLLKDEWVLGKCKCKPEQNRIQNQADLTFLYDQVPSYQVTAL